MTDVAPPAKASRGRGPMLLVAVVAVVFAIGISAGFFAGGLFGRDEAPHEVAEAEPEPAEDTSTRVEVDVGRITVVIPADDPRGGTLHLLITPLVVGHFEGEPAEESGHGAPADEEAAPGPVPELRDSFIEYLSQLHETEVRGSAGLLNMRAELLRRAKAVAPDLNASAVLIQEFVIQ